MVKVKHNTGLTIAAMFMISLMLAVSCFAGSSEMETVEIIDVQGDQFKGKMLVIQDPARVFCGRIPEFGETDGLVVLDIMETYQKQGTAVMGGINAGAFVNNDADILFTGLPVGTVVCDGEVVYQEDIPENETFHLVGITKEDRLVTGAFSAYELTKLELRDAVCTDPLTSPFLIQDGEIVDGLPEEFEFGGGKNPRTAIGQREDGAILLLVIDGRQTSSLGATPMELAQCMKEYGAVNAAAMTGGSSSQMVYEGEVVSSPYVPDGPGKCPTAWLIR